MNKITIDLDKLPKGGLVDLGNCLVSVAKQHDAIIEEAPPPDDRLDVIFEFAELMEWKPVRYASEIGVTWTLDGEVIKRSLSVGYLEKIDAGCSAAAYSFRRWGGIYESLIHEKQINVAARGTTARQPLAEAACANRNEAAVRAVLAAVKAEAKR